MMYLLFGKEYFLLKDKINEIIEKSNTDNIVYMDFDQNSIMDIIKELCSVDLFNSKKVIIINDFTFSIKDEKEFERLIDINTDNVLVFKCTDETIDKRKSLYKKMSTKATIYEFSSIEKEDLIKYILEMFKKEKFIIDKYIVIKILNECGYSKYIDSSYIINEVNKLILYKNDDKNITESDIKLIISKNTDNEIFELVNALIQSDTNKVFREFKLLYDLNVDPYYILNSISKKIRELLQIKLLFDEMSIEQISIKLGMPRYGVEVMSKSLNMYTVESLAKVIDTLFNTDEIMKSETVDGYDILKQLFIDLLQKY